MSSLSRLIAKTRAVGRRLVTRGSADSAPRRPAADPSASPSSAPAADPLATELQALTEAERHEEAMALVERVLDADPEEPVSNAVLRQMRLSTSRAGAMGLQIRALELTVSRFADEKTRASLRRVEGRWRETEPGWLPTVADEVAGTLVPRDPARERTGRILHLLKIGMPQRQSGYSMRSMYILSGQKQAGLDPVAVTALDFPVSVGMTDVEPVEIVNDVPYIHLLRDEMPAGEPWDSYLAAYATALAPVVAEQQPDLIHVHSGHRGYEPALVGLAVGRLLGIPVVYEVRGFFESLWTGEDSWAEKSETYARRHAIETWCMREADGVVTLSESMRGDIVARGVDPEHVHVVPNGVDPAVFVPRPRDEELAAELGLTGRFVFGYVSNLDHRREAQELLIEAAVELRRRGVAATALIVGDGKRMDKLRALAKEVDAEDVVLFTGKVPHDRVGDYYALLDVFVVPRIDERAARLVTPLKPYEAMALGVPLVVSDLPALQEITGDGARGATFRTGSAVSLADTLEGLAADPGRRDSLATAAREWVTTERDWAINGQRYQRIYDAILGSSSDR